MRWAFWRRQATRERRAEDPRPLPDEVGLPPAELRSSDRGAATPVDPDDDPRQPRRSGTDPFSGASPDAAGLAASRRQAGAPRVPSTEPATGDEAATGQASRRAAGSVVVGAVRALLDDIRAFEPALRPATSTAPVTPIAAACAQRVLAARLPALSGVTGDVVFDEPQDELLHAYADLLAERAEPLRRSVAPDLREVVGRVAHLAATAAHEATAPGPAAGLQQHLSVDLDPRDQLAAACVLLAQTARDGGGTLDDLQRELADQIEVSREEPPA